MKPAIWVSGSGTVDPLDRGLTLGDGVFDTLVAFRRIPFAAQMHLQRLTSHAEAIGIPFDHEVVRAGWRAVLAKAEAEHVILRTTVTRGGTERGLWPRAVAAPTIMVSAAPWDRSVVGREVRLVTSSVVRNAGSPTSRLKTIGYLDNILAAREAAERGADDALLLNASGRVACTTIANVFAVQGARLATPPASDGVMPGIMRALVMESAEQVGLESAETSLSIADLFAADAVFVTNSVRFLSPVTALEGQPLGRSAAAKLNTILAALSRQVEGECGFDPSREGRGHSSLSGSRAAP